LGICRGKYDALFFILTRCFYVVVLVRRQEGFRMAHLLLWFGSQERTTTLG
jgi:hypothetical protein